MRIDARPFLVTFALACSTDTFSAPDATTDAVDEVCSDPTFCEDKCGTGLANMCGVATDCRTDCGENKTCDGVTHQCVCSADNSWCINRCGQTQDNCGSNVDCGACEAGACVNNACGCTPDAAKKTCSTQGLACGPAKNNCGQVVDCGACSPAQNCSSGQCCDDDSITCAGKCGVITNNCGKLVACSCTALAQVCCVNECVSLSKCTDH